MASRTQEIFLPAIKGKKIPILTLDNRWHRLFTQVNPSPEILRIEEELNTILKRQGKLTTEIKEIKKIKSKLMDEIVTMMDSTDPDTETALDDKKRLIEECNSKLEEYQDEMYDIPKEIANVNQNLMIATMEVCYEQIQENTKEIEEISEWIKEIRNELKKKVIRKQEKQLKNQDFYTYMHDIFGADVIDIFDMKYNPEESKISSGKSIEVIDTSKKKNEPSPE